MVHLSKEHYPLGTYNMLKTKNVDSYPIIQKIYNNSYIIGMLVDWKMSKTFNVKDLFKYYPPDVAKIIEWYSMESSSSKD